MLPLWFHRQRPRPPYQWRAFWIALAIVAPIWCLLDIVLGNAFFRVPDTGTTFGILARVRVRAWMGADHPDREAQFAGETGGTVASLPTSESSNACRAPHCGVASVSDSSFDSRSPAWSG